MLAIKAMNVLKRAFGDVTISGMGVGGQVPSLGVDWNKGADRRLADIKAAADLYMPGTLLEALNWLCEHHKTRRQPLRLLGGRPVDLVFVEGGVLIAAYISGGQLFIFDEHGCRSIVRLGERFRYRVLRRPEEDKTGNGLCPRCGRDTTGAYCSRCQSNGRTQINDQWGRRARAVRTVDMDVSDE